MGFLGILEPKIKQDVPGTVLLDTTGAASIRGEGTLKRACGKNSHIILVPQPSDDPNDPLNFSNTRKLIILCVISFGTCIWGATIPPLLNAGLVQIALELDVSVTAVVQASGYQLLVVAASITLVNAAASRWGKRPVFLASGVAGMIGNIVGSTASSYNHLLAARIIQGFSSSAYESLVMSMLGDLYFVHERGIYAATINFLLGAISNFSSVICGVIVTKLGWKYLFHLASAFGGLQLLLQFLFVPETQYNRVVPRRVSADEKCDQDVDSKGIADMAASEIENAASSGFSKSPMTFRQRLAIVNGTFSHRSPLKAVFGPIVACLNLSILWVVIITGYFLSMYVTVAYLLAQLFTAPPYLLDAAGVGYLNVGPFIGGLLAGITAALVNDRLMRWLAHRNNGVFEPEYRLLLGVGGLFSIAGFVGFGYAVEAGESYYLTSFCHGLGLFGIIFVFVSTSNYALDAFSELDNEIFLASMAMKNLVIYAYSYFINDWAARVGPAQVLWVLSAVGAGMLLTFPLMFVFGKRYRVYWSNHNMLAKFYRD